MFHVLFCFFVSVGALRSVSSASAALKCYRRYVYGVILCFMHNGIGSINKLTILFRH